MQLVNGFCKNVSWTNVTMFGLCGI